MRGGERERCLPVFQACLDRIGGHTAVMNDEDAERVTRLESAVAHMEYLVEQLNSVVSEQAREIAQLKKQVQRQSDTLETMELERIKSTNPTPPHYGKVS